MPLFPNSGRSLPILMTHISIFSRPFWNRPIKFVGMPTPTELIHVINYFQTKIVNQCSISPWNILGYVDVKNS
jgi:hypothetical protein